MRRIGLPVLEPESGCLIWQGALDKDGYGRTWHHGKRIKAHRAAYIDGKGEIPEGLEIDHLCFNPSCVNPDHLEAVTHAENIRRGRHTKLTVEQVRKIRVSPESNTAWARRLGVSDSAISFARRGLNFRDVEPVPDIYRNSTRLMRRSAVANAVAKEPEA